MENKIKQLRIGEQIYKFADYDLTEFLKNSENYNKIIKVDEEGNLSITALEQKGEATDGETVYATLAEAVAATTTGAITLLEDVVLNAQLRIKTGQDITIDFNGHNIRPANTLSLSTDLVGVEYGATLTLNGIGGIYAGADVWSAVGTCNGDKTGSGQVSKLVINNGHYEGLYYAVCSEGSKTDNSSVIEINGGSFTTINKKDGIAIYNPAYNNTLTINGGDFIGATACEVRSGNVVITDGYFNALSPFTAVPSGGGATTTGCALAVVQHITKKPIDIKVTGGLFVGDYAFYQANLQKNEQEAVDKITLSITGSGLKGTVYSENKTKFINAAKCSLSEELDESYKV